MSKPAARITDLHVCPVADGPKPHVGGPITTGFLKVLIGGQPAARIQDLATCVSPAPDVITNGAPTVWIGGMPAARMTDTTVHGGSITTGCLTVVLADPTADDWLIAMLVILCPADKAVLDKLRAGVIPVVGFDRIYWEDPYFDGKKWTTRHFEGGGSANGAINMLTSQGPINNAATLYHEAWHKGQPASMSMAEKEYDAYTKEDEWRLKKGFPPHDPSFRKKDAAGNEVTDTDAIRKFVNNEYPVTTAKATPGKPPPPAPDQVIGKTKSGQTIMQNPTTGKKYTRPPKKGDVFPGPQVSIPPRGRLADPAKLKCP